jgi:hypothetical protein
VDSSKPWQVKLNVMPRSVLIDMYTVLAMMAEAMKDGLALAKMMVYNVIAAELDSTEDH